MKLLKYLRAGGRYLTDPKYRFRLNAALGKYNHMSDEEYLKKLFYASMGKTLNLDNPQTFNEKLQWLKLYNRKPEYTMMVDKYKVREYIAQKLGTEYLISLLGVWNTPEEIDFNKLPDKFVLKCNHNSGLGMYICQDKSKMDVGQVKKELWKGLKQEYYLTGREWPYKKVKRKIIAEKYMEDDAVHELRDYKFFCFNGEPRITLVCTDRFSLDGLKEDFFDSNWTHLPMQRPTHANASELIPKPKSYDLMVHFAEELSKEMPFLRVDFYDINGHVYFGELTFFPASGLEKFEPEEWDERLGSWIKLPKKELL